MIKYLSMGTCESVSQGGIGLLPHAIMFWARAGSLIVTSYLGCIGSMQVLEDRAVTWFGIRQGLDQAWLSSSSIRNGLLQQKPIASSSCREALLLQHRATTSSCSLRCHDAVSGVRLSLDSGDIAEMESFSVERFLVESLI